MRTAARAESAAPLENNIVSGEYVGIVRVAPAWSTVWQWGALRVAVVGVYLRTRPASDRARIARQPSFSHRLIDTACAEEAVRTTTEGVATSETSSGP